MPAKYQVPLLAALSLSAALLACGLPLNAGTVPPPSGQNSNETSIAPTETVQPIQIASATDQSASGGTPVSFAGTSFSLPAVLASNAATQFATDFEGGIMTSDGVNPKHIKILLNDYALSGVGDAYVVVFLASDFASIGSQETIDDLASLPASVGPNLPILKGLPFYARAQIISFQNGRGLRLLTQNLQSQAPIDNAELYYSFRGLTSDGKYYVAASFPVKADFLQANGNADTTPPAGGIAFPSTFDMTEFEKYIGQVQQKMDDANPASFTPDLAAMDTLIQSIKVVAP